jgi:hypothetical protein
MPDTRTRTPEILPSNRLEHKVLLLLFCGPYPTSLHLLRANRERHLNART